jgi:hypothetical protein
MFDALSDRFDSIFGKLRNRGKLTDSDIDQVAREIRLALLEADVNVGVVKADAEGVATLMVRNPQPYTVPWMGRLEPHVHFRECGDNGMVGRIFTVYTSSGKVEAFNMIE